MPGLDFDPLTGQLGIAGTSYRLQLGLINGKWVVNLLKGKITIDTKIINEDDLVGDIPPPDLIVRWVLRAITIPNINPRHVKKTVLILLNQAKANKAKKKKIASIKEANEVELKSIPKSDLKIPKPTGWVAKNEPTDVINRKKAESHGLENIACNSCGYQIKYCPNCGTGINEND